jgi:hypothetical protein
MELARHLRDAVARVVREHAPAGPGRELVLHGRLREALARVSPLAVSDGEGRLDDHGRGWTRPPGGIDLLATSADADGPFALGAEVKIGKLDELLWDAIKIGQRRGARWPGGLALSALIVELQPGDLEHPLAPRWFDETLREVDVTAAIRGWPKAWYGLMCGGRGIRPTSLPRTVRLGVGSTHRYADGTLLCWRTIDADRIDGERVAVDQHGFPAGIEIPETWRQQIELGSAAAREPLRKRTTLTPPPTRTTVSIARDGDGRLWADVWAAGFSVPTSFRLVGELDYDLRVSSNDAQHRPSTPTPLPAWCRAAVQEERERGQT